MLAVGASKAHVVCELSFKGAASESVRAMFPDFEVVPAHGSTTLRGALPDLAALHGAISRIRDLGLELLDVRLVAQERPIHIQSAARGGDAFGRNRCPWA